MASDKIESVQKTSEAMGSKATDLPEDAERIAPNKEHFQNLMNSTQPLQSAFQKMGEAAAVPPAEKPLEESSVFTQESTSAGKTGTATDDEGKGGKKRQGQPDDEIEGISAAGSKKKSSIESSALMSEMNTVGAQVGKMARLSPESLKQEVGQVISQIEGIKTKLSQASDIKPSYQTLLRNRLAHIDDNLKIALSKAGVEYTPPVQSAEGRVNPIVEFIELLTRNQKQAETLNTSIDSMTNEKGEISAANMFKIQIKVHNVQQQIELFTSMLNKALEGIKTIMNVQV